MDPSDAARALREARRYEALVADAGLLVWAMNPQLRPTGRNLAWERYTGQSEAEYGGLGWLNVVLEADRARCVREIQANVPNERSFTLEVAIRRRDGAFRRHFVRAIPVRDETGALVEWIGTATDVEDERCALEQLVTVNARQRLTYETARIGTWEWFPVRGELRWSDEMYRMLGLHPGEIPPAAEAWAAAIHPDDADAATRVWLTALREGSSLTQEYRIVQRDGEVRWVMSRTTMLRDEVGSVICILGLNMDVTERHLMEEQMTAALAEHRDLRQRLVALTDGAEAVLRAATIEDVRVAICELASRVLPADAYAVWTLDQSTSTWSVDASRGLSDGFVEQRVPGVELPFSDPLVADVLSSEVLSSRRAAYEAEGLRSVISVPLRIDGIRRGAIVTYYRTARATTDAERQVAVALGHLAAAALGNAEARLRQEQLRVEAERHSGRMAFLAEASSAFSTIDYEASFRRLADLAVPFLADWCRIDVEHDGCLVRVAVAHPDPEKLEIAERLRPRRIPVADDPSGIARVLRSGRPELARRLTDEQLAASARSPEALDALRSLNVRSAIVAPLTARGRTLGVISLVSSTPGREYDESDLAFVELVARRAAMVIDNARLFEEARRANQAKDEFLAVLSHELRTPLNAIMGWTQILQTKHAAAIVEPGLDRGLEVIQRNAKLQAELVDGLLDVTRVATGGLPLSRRLIDASEIAAAVAENIRPAAADRGLQLRFLREGECLVLADPNRLQQILNNLLSNALKFTDRGGQVEVRVRRAGEWCEIQVADTGVGIDGEFLPFVFQRFSQADSSPTRRHGGLGLGLWLVHELVKAHAGTIRAASGGPDRGATFTIELPLAATESASERVQ